MPFPFMRSEFGFNNENNNRICRGVYRANIIAEDYALSVLKVDHFGNPTKLNELRKRLRETTAEEYIKKYDLKFNK